MIFPNQALARAGVVIKALARAGVITKALAHAGVVIKALALCWSLSLLDVELAPSRGVRC
jgi:hypothetical protein